MLHFTTSKGRDILFHGHVLHETHRNIFRCDPQMMLAIIKVDQIAK